MDEETDPVTEDGEVEIYGPRRKPKYSDVNPIHSLLLTAMWNQSIFFFF